MKTRGWLWMVCVCLLLAGTILLVEYHPILSEVEANQSKLQHALDEGDALVAGETLEALAGLQPHQPELWQQAGEKYLEGGDLSDSIRMFTKAEGLGSLDANGWLAFGNALSSTDGEQATEKWKLAIQSGNPQAYSRLGSYYRYQKDWENYQALLEQWVTALPADGQAYYKLGLLKIAIGAEDGIDALRIAREKNPEQSTYISQVENAYYVGSFSAYLGYQNLLVGRALGSLGDWDLAELAFLKTIDLAPDYAEAWAFLSEAKLQQNQGGEVEIQKALEMDPESTIVKALFAMRLRRDGKQAEALPYLQTISVAEPEQIVWRLEIASTMAELGQVNEALAEFQGALKIDPNNLTALKALAKFCIQYNMDLRTSGLQAARQAVSLAPHDPEALDLQGWIFFLLEDSTSAERFLQRALEEDPNYVNTYLHLGQLYLKLQQSTQAYQNLKHASTLAEDGSTTQLIINRLLERYFGEVEKTP